MKNKTKTILFLSHGGGPLPLLGDESHSEMVKNLKILAEEIDKPSAIILISAHWEEEIPTITSAATPSLSYDYYGFPEESYQIQYPCPGEPLLANEVRRLLNKSGINTRLDEHRGFDHGLFVPLKIMYPNADIPCVQLSLLKSLNPAEHIRIGSALSEIKYEKLLIIGSGFSFHNMRAFFNTQTAETKAMNESFEQWLIDTCSNQEIGEAERTKRLENWENAPFGRYCHPREEHLLPLHICYGVAQSACKKYIELRILNKKSSFYLW
ncbi:Extradiol ring-cleavage dioxygenase class III protein subunit B [Chloroherpeton thalassium ATCC 35110]|uniref:Extradiol ring-cleavage dioxygenase class III protein subunit B n=1 Tax=Chloroherpeton thalassium (strain ATCC 35110 / GB-78) TaxID=517418 RepID=B3QXV4_CHLT3|nr:Extradiol ring-cleavage dioxygenase class III protein subunit B [Chloroherpeton thalassium ATCC 35110]